jgi:hypothetical protein
MLPNFERVLQVGKSAGGPKRDPGGSPPTKIA